MLVCTHSKWGNEPNVCAVGRHFPSRRPHPPQVHGATCRQELARCTWSTECRSRTSDATRHGRHRTSLTGVESEHATAAQHAQPHERTDRDDGGEDGGTRGCMVARRAPGPGVSASGSPLTSRTPQVTTRHDTTGDKCGMEDIVGRTGGWTNGRDGCDDAASVVIDRILASACPVVVCRVVCGVRVVFCPVQTFQLSRSPFCLPMV
jgi:hypothetical protein